MTNQEMRTLEAFRRGLNFDATHPELFAAGTLARELFDELASVVLELEGYATAQSTGGGKARQGTVSKAVARAAILEDLGMLRRTARSLAHLIPGVEMKFRFPPRPADQELFETARAILTHAEPLRAEFLRREVPETLFSDLEQNLAAFQDALNEQFTGKGESVMAVAAIDAAIERGTNLLRQLDPIVRNKLHQDPATLAAWLSAKRIERAPRRTTNNTPTPPAPPTPQP